MNPEFHTSNISDISLKQAARIAGIGYLLIFAVSIFANSFALEKLINLEDVSTTIQEPQVK